MNNEIVDHAQWTAARIELLEAEKAFTKARDALCAKRQALPWELVEKNYHFESESGTVSLADLFEGRSQLIIYHFMFGPDWETGCPSCSFCADHFERAAIHLAQRDVSLATVSRAPLSKLLPFKSRMGWTFPWVSSEHSDFNYDYNVSFSKDELENAYYNYRQSGFPADEAPGVSVFYKSEDGSIYHTYSSYGRGLEDFITTYRYLDIVPKGRDEDSLSFSMEWIRRWDEYGD